MKNRKGFTLIELLAVIVILAIIALIAVPIVLNMITQARRSAARSAALGYVDAIEYNNGFANAEMDGYTLITGTKNVSEINVKMKGKKPDSGSVTITNDGKVESATLCINGYNVTYTGKDAKVEGKCSSGNNNSNEVYLYSQFGLHDSTTLEYTIPIELYSLRQSNGQLLTQGLNEIPLYASASTCSTGEQDYSGYYVNCHKEYSKGDHITYNSYLKKTGIPNQIAEKDIYDINYEVSNESKANMMSKSGLTASEVDNIIDSTVVELLGESSKSECEQKLASIYGSLQSANDQGFSCTLKHHSGDSYTKITKYQICLVNNNKEVCINPTMNSEDVTAEYRSEKKSEFENAGLYCFDDPNTLICVDDTGENITYDNVKYTKLIYGMTPALTINIANKVMRCMVYSGLYMCSMDRLFY